jgi:uncharacterized protein (DUF302 family)
MTSAADNGIVTQASRHSVDHTVHKLKQILDAKGVALFTVIDHSGEAEKVGIKMAPTQLLIFGNPKAGTPIMLASPSAAIDLPLKILVWEDNQRKVWVSYNSPEYLQKRHGFPLELLKNLAVIENLAAEVAQSVGPAQGSNRPQSLSGPIGRAPSAGCVLYLRSHRDEWFSRFRRDYFRTKPSECPTRKDLGLESSQATPEASPTPLRNSHVTSQTKFADRWNTLDLSAMAGLSGWLRCLVGSLVVAGIFLSCRKYPPVVGCLLCSGAVL